MKTVILLALVMFAMPANATVLCQSVSDPTYKAYFPGYSCPAGYFMTVG